MKLEKLGLAQQTLDALDIRLGNVRSALQATDTSGRFALQEVTAVSLLVAQFAGTGNPDTLCGTFMDLLLHVKTFPYRSLTLAA